MEYSKDFVRVVANVHRAFGFGVKIANRKGKQYITLNSKNVKARPFTYWNSHKALSDHVTAIFPGAQCTSGSWGGNTFDATYRINP